MESKGGRMGTADIVIAFIGAFGTQEMLLVGLVALLLFGGKKLAGIGKGLGEGIRNFKDGMKGDDHEVKKQ
jgi:sec-independent protein translocase protein TatA